MTATGDDAAPGAMRLARRVAQLKGCSRSEAERYIEGGWVRVNGQVVEVPALKVTNERVEIDPRATLADTGPVTLLLHQPPGHDTPAALSLMRPEARVETGPETGGKGLRVLRKHFTGLDALLPLPSQASGLAVFTQDWRVRRKLDTDGAEEEVMAEVQGQVAAAQLHRLCHGLVLDGRPLPPIKVSINSSGAEQTRLRFALQGVRVDQVPAMCDAVGLLLLTLRRLRIGRVSLRGLAPGQWRYLLPFERF